MPKKFHIKHDGSVEVCNEKQDNCPLGDSTNHYLTEFDAYLSLEYYLFQQKMEQIYGYYENSQEHKRHLEILEQLKSSLSN